MKEDSSEEQTSTTDTESQEDPSESEQEEEKSKKESKPKKSAEMKSLEEKRCGMCGKEGHMAWQCEDRACSLCGGNHVLHQCAKYPTSKDKRKYLIKTARCPECGKLNHEDHKCAIVVPCGECQSWSHREVFCNKESA